MVKSPRMENERKYAIPLDVRRCQLSNTSSGIDGLTADHVQLADTSVLLSLLVSTHVVWTVTIINDKRFTNGVRQNMQTASDKICADQLASFF